MAQPDSVKIQDFEVGKMYVMSGMYLYKLDSDGCYLCKGLEDDKWEHMQLKKVWLDQSYIEAAKAGWVTTDEKGIEL